MNWFWLSSESLSVRLEWLKKGINLGHPNYFYDNLFCFLHSVPWFQHQTRIKHHNCGFKLHWTFYVCEEGNLQYLNPTLFSPSLHISSPLSLYLSSSRTLTPVWLFWQPKVWTYRVCLRKVSWEKERKTNFFSVVPLGLNVLFWFTLRYFWRASQYEMDTYCIHSGLTLAVNMLWHLSFLVFFCFLLWSFCILLLNYISVDNVLPSKSQPPGSLSLNLSLALSLSVSLPPCLYPLILLPSSAPQRSAMGI